MKIIRKTYGASSNFTYVDHKRQQTGPEMVEICRRRITWLSRSAAVHRRYPGDLSPSRAAAPVYRTRRPARGRREVPGLSPHPIAVTGPTAGLHGGTGTRRCPGGESRGASEVCSCQMGGPMSSIVRTHFQSVMVTAGSGRRSEERPPTAPHRLYTPAPGSVCVVIHVTSRDAATNQSARRQVVQRGGMRSRGVGGVISANQLTDTRRIS